MQKSAEPIPFQNASYVIHSGRFWDIILHRDNQYYLGRCIIFLKSRILEDPLLLSDDEQQELWGELVPRLVGALRKAFTPDRINYAHLANQLHFVHWHIVPRYEIDPVRLFAGETFIDERAGKCYSPSPQKSLPKEKMELIFQEIIKYF